MTSFVGLFGGMVASVGAMQQAEAQAAAQEYNAKIAEQNAKLAKQQGQADALQSGIISYKALGDMRAGYGASGVTIEGTPLDVLEESTRQAELEKQNILYNAELEAIGFKNEARLATYSASTTRVGGAIQGAALALSATSTFMAQQPVATQTRVGSSLRA